MKIKSGISIPGTGPTLPVPPQEIPPEQTDITRFLGGLFRHEISTLLTLSQKDGGSILNQSCFEHDKNLHQKIAWMFKNEETLPPEITLQIIVLARVKFQIDPYDFPFAEEENA